MIKHVIGDSSLTVEHEGEEYSPEDRASRQAYTLTITAPEFKYMDNTFRSGVDADVDEAEMLRTAASFLSACAEAQDSEYSDNHGLFPPHVAEWAVENSDEIDLLSLEDE